jgi:uncharacterized protein
VRILVLRIVLRRRRRRVWRRVRRVRRMNADLFGLGWRAPLGPGILLNLDRIEVVEVMADDFFGASRSALRTLAAQVPVVVHGVSLGLASAVPVARRRLERFARVVEAARPLFWSEHLAFVRGGDVEIGHLAAPPRTAATVAGAVDNIRRAAEVVGLTPLVENVATLIDPPASTMAEAPWLSGILRGAGADLLLDLHNLYANAVNFGLDPPALLAALPAERIAAVHLAGGRWLGQGRLLDDHLHAVPDPVYELLTAVGASAPRPLVVILERDGAYPPMAQLLAELDRARAALASGRARSAA